MDVYATGLGLAAERAERKVTHFEEFLLGGTHVRDQCWPADAENSSTSKPVRERIQKTRLKMASTHAASILTHVPAAGIVALPIQAAFVAGNEMDQPEFSTAGIRFMRIRNA